MTTSSDPYGRRPLGDRTPSVIAVALAFVAGLTLAAAMTRFGNRDGALTLTAFASLAALVAWRAHPAAAALSGFLVASFWNFFCVPPYEVLHANARVAVGTLILTAVPGVVSLGREVVWWLSRG